MNNIVFDMYGVIIEESKGNFIPFTKSHFPEVELPFLIENFSAAGIGKIDSDTFLSKMGFENPEMKMREYIENHLTLDRQAVPFFQNNKDRFDFYLISNDVLHWNRYLMEFHNLSGYLKERVISGEVGVKKPGKKIFQLFLEKTGLRAEDCVFIDNSVKNLRTASDLGFHSIHFNRDRESYDGDTVNNFKELESLLLSRESQ